MSKRTLYVLGMLITVIITCFLQWKFCCNSDVALLKEDTNKVVAIPKATFFPFAIKDANGNLSLNINENFNFKESNFNFLTPISTNVDTGIDKLKEYLATNNGKSIAITGFYKSNEENTSMYPNLGIARANAIKNYFTSKGIPSKIINTFGKLEEDMVADADKIYHGPVSFEILKDENNNKDDELAKLLAEINANPLILHFNVGQASTNLTQKQREKIKDISTYLDKKEGSSCLIVGHADSTGSDELNMNLGQKRADFTKSRFVQNAIDAKKISTTSKGENEPIADNNTKEGRAKNRRTEIIIK